MPSTSRNTGLHVRWEKAGLILDALPIPWNADAVIVEAIVGLPANAPREKQDFTLRLADQSASAELVARGEGKKPLRVLFRVRTPAQSTTAEVSWREHVLGRIDVPMLAKSAFVDGLAVETPTVFALIASQTVACSAFVTTQAKQLFASTLVRSVGPLAAAQDLDLRVEVSHDRLGNVGMMPIAFTNEQCRSRTALVSAPLPKLRSVGSYRVSWFLAGRSLHAQTLRAVSKKTFQHSLRISATRFIVETDDGKLQTVRVLPMRDGRLTDGIRRIAPCFFVSSGEAGLAGAAPFAVSAVVEGMPKPLAASDVLVTDGPTPVLLGSVAGRDLERIRHFQLCSGERVLGNLPLVPAPLAEFTAEGGFAPLDDYLWSAAAEEQLDERLGKLLDDG